MDDTKTEPTELKVKKATDIEDKDLKLKIPWPWLMPDLRDKAYKWYPGPEFCAHKMHWTEWLFAIFFILAVVVLILGSSKFPVYIFAMLLTVNATLALIFIWGFAKYKSLADLATRLEKLAEQNHAEVGAYQQINNEWDEGLKRGQENLNDFTNSLGLVQDDAEALNGLTDALKSLVSQKKKIQQEEKMLFEIQVKHQKVTRAEIDEKERTTMKKQLTRMFDRIVRASKTERSVETPEDIELLRKKLQENTFLNQTIPDTDDPMFAWLPKFTHMAEDGKITKYELLDALDQSTNSYFLQIKDARTKQTELQKELDEWKNKPL